MAQDRGLAEVCYIRRRVEEGIRTGRVFLTTPEAVKSTLLTYSDLMLAEKNAALAIPPVSLVSDSSISDKDPVKHTGLHISEAHWSTSPPTTTKTTSRSITKTTTESVVKTDTIVKQSSVKPLGGLGFMTLETGTTESKDGKESKGSRDKGLSVSGLAADQIKLILNYFRGSCNIHDISTSSPEHGDSLDVASNSKGPDSRGSKMLTLKPGLAIIDEFDSVLVRPIWFYDVETKTC